MARRVVVTGMGAISPLGLDVPSLWAGLIEGRSGVGPITHFDPQGYETRIAAEVKGFDPLNYMDAKLARRCDRFAQFALAASEEAVRMAELHIDLGYAEKSGVIIGTSVGGYATLLRQHRVLLERGPKFVSPFLMPMAIPNMASSQIAIRFGIKGVNFAPVSACASSAHALGEAFAIIQRGDADVILAGGSDASIEPLSVAGLSAAHSLSRRNEAPERASRPFDALRDGFVLGEGAGVLVLEALECALRRDAPILAEILGYAATSDAFHITAPDPEGRELARAMRLALERARVAPSEVAYINAHGTSTPLNDVVETRAIKAVFGEYAYRIPVSSSKSMVGHLQGAAAAVETVACIQTIRTGTIHPTINYEFPDPQCDLDYVPNLPREANVHIVLKCSMGFGGLNVALVLGRYEC